MEYGPLYNFDKWHLFIYDKKHEYFITGQTMAS